MNDLVVIEKEELLLRHNQIPFLYYYHKTRQIVKKRGGEG